MPEGNEGGKSESTKAGSWLGDFTNEWHKAKTPEKVLIVGIILGVIGIVWYLHNQSANASQSSSTPGGILPPASSPTGGGVPTGTGSPIPPQPGPSGGGGNGGGGGSGEGGGGGGGKPPKGGGGGEGGGGGGGGKPPKGGGGTPPQTPLFGNNAPTGLGSKWGTLWTGPNGTLYQTGPGSNGNIWGVPILAGESPFSLQQWNNVPIAPGGKVLLYAPAGQTPPKQGGGPYGTAVLSVKHSRIAPSREGRPYVTRTYAKRIR